MYDSTNDTLLHIKRVNSLLIEFAKELLTRAQVHDQSKLESPEKEAFDIHTPKLAKSTYGSEEYEKALEGLGPALHHHYVNNSHHPEFYVNGIEGMNLLDLVEMFFDWKAATERMASGNIHKSIEINKDRFKMDPQVAAIFSNTAKRLGY